jgi:hypothetical protein
MNPETAGGPPRKSKPPIVGGTREVSIDTFVAPKPVRRAKSAGFVRWQTYRSQALRPRQRAQNDKHARQKAVLVESVRVDGKPRQRHIAFLGSMRIDRRDERRFWREVTTRFDQLGNRVGPEDRERLLASIAKKVGGRPMTTAELEQFARESDDLLRQIREARCR